MERIKRYSATNSNEKSKRVKVELRLNKNKLSKERKEITNMTDKMFMEVQDVIEILNISEGKAYEIIRMLNAELKEKGYIVVRGKVNTKYFFKKLIYNEE